MPYYRRRTYRKRRYPKRYGGTRTMRRVARKEATKVVNRNVESKYWDGQQVDLSMTTAGTRIDLVTDPNGSATISQGVGDNQYIGSWIKPIYLTIRGGLAVNASETYVRIVVIQVKGSGNPTAAGLLETVSSAMVAFSPLDKDTLSVFTVLADRTIRMSPDGKDSAYFKIKIPWSKLKRRVYFTDNAGTYESGGLFMYVYSSVDGTFNAYWRLSYKDA